MFAKVPMLGEFLYGREAIVNHSLAGDVKYGTLVNFIVGAGQYHGIVVVTDEEDGSWGVQTKEDGIIELFSPKFNNYTIHDVQAVRYAA